MSVAGLHPSARRRLERMMPPEPRHEVVLRALGAGDARTIVATSRARNFVETLLEDLAASDWRRRLGAMRGVRRGDDGLLELSLPTHRSFQLALFEALCREPGSPRLDPARIASQGLVLRRHGGGGWSGWTKRGKRLAGWQRVGNDEDPDPALRDAAPSANAAVRELLAARRPATALAEEIIPLYLAPPNVCEVRGRTILFAVIPVVSSDRIEAAAPRLDYASHPQRGEFERHLSEYLKARPQLAMPRAGIALDPRWNLLDQTPSADPEQPRLYALGLFLQQMLVELGIGEGGAGAGRLMQLLGQIRLPTRRDGAGQISATVDAATFVRRAGAILMEGESNPDGFAMPLEWPRIDESLGARLTEAALACLSDQHARLETAPGKFDRAADQYAVRGFIRVRGHDGCPDRLVWSPYSERFRVAPWWDGDGPGVKIVLPSFSQLKKVKPNVTFEMPPPLANLLKGDMKKLAEGEGSTSGMELGWLCSFSLPIITLCAFIVLNIFLSLFDLFLRWMMFVKICIPIPKKSEGS